MQERETNYTALLTDEDRIKLRFKRRGHSISEFSVQYETLVKGRWRRVTRIDSIHDNVHRHIFSPNGEEYSQAFICTDLNDGLTKARAFLREEYHSIKSNYLTQLEKGRI